MGLTTADIRRHSAHFSRYIAVLIIATYVSGFITFSLHTASFGFFEGNPFKIRTIAAGALFVFFATIPIILFRYSMRSSENVASRSEGVDQEERDIDSIKSIVSNFLHFIMLSIVAISSASGYLFTDSHFSGSTFLGDYRSYILLCTVLLAIIRAIVLDMDFYRKRTKLSLSVDLFLLILIFFNVFIWWKWSNRPSLLLWFCISSGLYAYAHHCIKQKFDWRWIIDFLPLVIAGIVFYSTVVYPKIQFSWGGGGLVSAIIFLKEDSRILSADFIRVDIVDETDIGLYAIPKLQNKALFIPRESIQAVYYSNQPMYLGEAIKAPYGPWQN